MKKYCTIDKNKAFIILTTVIFTFSILSLSLIIQILVNSRYKIFETNYNTLISVNKINFLDEILRKEIELVETSINDDKIESPATYFDKNFNEERIFLLNNFNERLSQGGYRIYSDKENSNYYEVLSGRIKNVYPKNISINYDKKILIDDKSFLIRATVSYKTDISKKPKI